MTQLPFSRRIAAVLESITPIARFATESAYARRRDELANCDFVFGNPHEMPLPDYTAMLQRWVVPQRDDWFAYKMNEPAGQAVIAGSLRDRHRLPFEDEDVFLTTGAFAGLAITLGAVIDPGDEVIYVSPPWFFYEAQILASEARPVRVPIDRATFDLDLEAIAAAITERTRAIIVNSPHNPTGKIYPPETLAELARILTRASERHGRAIYLLSDEAYSRIIFDGREFHSPTRYYPSSFLIRWSLN